MKRHGPTRQSSTESHTAEWRTEICVAFSRLTEIGEQAVAAVAASLARGGPVIKGQLIASRFYEAMQRELKHLPMHDPKRAALIAASDRCERIAEGPCCADGRTSIGAATNKGAAVTAADRRRTF